MNFNIHSLQNWYRSLLQNPKYRWWVVAASLAYLLSPIDVIPDFLPVAGWLDDTITISLLVTEVAQFAKTKLQSQTNKTKTDSTEAAAQIIDIEPVTVN